MTIRFQRIDESNLRDHTFIRSTDVCLFLREYTAGAGYSSSETNSLISNLKKKQGAGGYQYKAIAIRKCAQEIVAASDPDAWLPGTTLVPVPPSKIRGDAGYDDRMTRVCRAIGQAWGKPVDLRELVRQTTSIRAAHENPNNRPTIEELRAVYEVDPELATPEPAQIAIVDDVLTAGTHYRAMHAILSERFPLCSIFGLFWARRALPASADAAIDFL